MKSLIQDYPLRFYVKDLYSKNANVRGGSILKPLLKKDIKAFQLRVKYAANMSKIVLEKIKYPYSEN